MYSQIKLYFKELAVGIVRLQCTMLYYNNNERKMLENNGQWWWAWCPIKHLSKTFDFFSHVFLNKPETYKFEISSIRLIYDYLGKRDETIKVNNANSWWREILYNIPQQLILGLPL